MQVVKCKTCHHFNRLTPAYQRHAQANGGYRCQKCTVPLKVGKITEVEPQVKDVSCPVCGRKQRHRPGAVYWCVNCSVSFDSDPGEGGDCYNSPEKSAEVHEQLARNKADARKAGRLNLPKRKRSA